ncbi:Mlo-related protein [Macleaya cordata]|uniref:MLO-like protein n=1 Tax=Macleaya cordata TaxID=56857 RepID=A0A200RAB0_MACCD|nr:Mlo-related protein [Macleaya cordata]
MDEEQETEGRSLFETPTWAVATVITAMVVVGILVNRSLERIGNWLGSTKRKALLSALQKIKEELMLFGLLSLLMGHWTIWVSKICVKSSALSSRFFPCTVEGYKSVTLPQQLLHITSFPSLNHSVFINQEKLQETESLEYCPEGHEPFASYESLEQLHRLLFVLGVIHVSYNFVTIALAMLKIYSWKTWESQAKSMAIEGLQGSSGVGKKSFKRLSTFVFHHTTHPWSKNKVLVWMLCFSRQFWSSINRADYMALRLGFLTNHELHLAYDFHSYMLRSMDDEFRDIVGISVPLWAYAIFCIFINFHGTNAYFWLSFIPAILILLVGTKLHHIVVKLALEVEGTNPCTGNQFKLRDELFWFGKPKLLLWLIQLISFQNAFEMATFIWSLWEIRGPSCFMENRVFLVIRLTSGIVSQFWCSFITFPLYVIITQMGSRFKKSVVSENIRESLQGWHKRAKKLKRDHQKSALSTATSSTSLDSMVDEMAKTNNVPSSSTPTSSSGLKNISSFIQPALHTQGQGEIYERSPTAENSQASLNFNPVCDSSDEDDDDRKDHSSFIPL